MPSVAFDPCVAEATDEFVRAGDVVHFDRAIARSKKCHQLRG